jgi:hypothetical protein
MIRQLRETSDAFNRRLTSSPGGSDLEIAAGGPSQPTPARWREEVSVAGARGQKWVIPWLGRLATVGSAPQNQEARVVELTAP